MKKYKIVPVMSEDIGRGNTHFIPTTDKLANEWIIYEDGQFMDFYSTRSEAEKTLKFIKEDNKRFTKKNPVPASRKRYAVASKRKRKTKPTTHKLRQSRKKTTRVAKHNPYVAQPHYIKGKFHNRKGDWYLSLMGGFTNQKKYAEEFSTQDAAQFHLDKIFKKLRDGYPSLSSVQVVS